MQTDVYPQGQKALAVFEQGMTPVLVRQFANLLLEQEKGETVLVCSGDDASGYNYTAGSLDRDMRAFGKELNARLQGRGGGRWCREHSGRRGKKLKKSFKSWRG